MSYIKRFETNSNEYKRLQALASMLNANTDSDLFYTVDTTYFDYGQNWLWTTIIAIDTTKPHDSILRSYQAMCPREQEILLSAETPIEGVCDCINWHNDNLSKWQTKW